MTNKGFTLLEMLLVVMMLSSLALLTLNNFKDLNNDHLLFMNEYLKTQNEALTRKEEMSLSKYGIFFYKSGRVNQARTISINNHKVIIHLGNGYLTYE